MDRRSFLEKSLLFLSSIPILAKKINISPTNTRKPEQLHEQETDTTRMIAAVKNFEILTEETNNLDLEKKFHSLYGVGVESIFPQLCWLNVDVKNNMLAIKKLLELKRPENALQFWKTISQDNDRYYELSKIGVLQKAPKYGIFPTVQTTDPDKKQDYDQELRILQKNLAKIGIHHLPWKIAVSIQDESIFRKGVGGTYAGLGFVFSVNDVVMTGTIELNENEVGASQTSNSSFLRTLSHEISHGLDILLTPILFRFLSPQEICRLLKRWADCIEAGRENNYPAHSGPFDLFSNNFEYPTRIFLTQGKYGYEKDAHISPGLKQKIEQSTASFPKLTPDSDPDKDNIPLNEFIKQHPAIRPFFERESIWKYFFVLLDRDAQIGNTKLSILKDVFLISSETELNKLIPALLTQILFFYIARDCYQNPDTMKIVLKDEFPETQKRTAQLLKLADHELFAEQGRIACDLLNNGQLKFLQEQPPKYSYILHYFQELGFSSMGNSKKSIW